ncbi:hypothetical protein [Streptomyces misionensis]|uniref:hypothetical protein n=1 Tax=Streptomyces misionensis TaxID=67331 RepID=UPI00339F664D
MGTTLLCTLLAVIAVTAFLLARKVRSSRLAHALAWVAMLAAAALLAIPFDATLRALGHLAEAGLR